MGDELHLELVFDDDVGFLFADGNVAVGIVDDVDDVAGPFLVDCRRALGHRRFGREQVGQIFVFDLDQLERLVGNLCVVGGHRRDLVADAADLIELERQVVLGETERDLGGVFGGDNRMDAR